jgi:hypothetical protein
MDEEEGRPIVPLGWGKCSWTVEVILKWNAYECVFTVYR